MPTRGSRHRQDEPELHESLVRPLAELFVAVLLLLLAAAAIAAAETPRHVDLYCHRTANEDVPENTLESLEQAALLGCDYVEVDVRRTYDGVLVLNHDGFLERFTADIGEVEQSYFDDLEHRDFGAWMSPRFAGLRIARFDDALRLARNLGIHLILDIKTPGLVTDIAAAVRAAQMWDRVSWPPDSDEVSKLLPGADTGADATWLQPGVTSEQIKQMHAQHKRVVVNFSANGHELDLTAMKAAVCDGADGINVDFPRVGADAVGRPVQPRLQALISAAESGAPAERSRAILRLARYAGFDLTGHFAQWLLDSDDHVLRAAAVALVRARPRVAPSVFDTALRSTNSSARANAAWALGQLGAPASTVLPLLSDRDPHVLAETLVALSRMSGAVPSDRVLELLQHGDIVVRGPAALALAAQSPRSASATIAAQLNAEVKLARAHYDRWAAPGKPKLAQSEIDVIVGYDRCQMLMVSALASLHDAAATQALEAEAFRPDLDFSQMNGLVAGFQLWDRIAADPAPAIAALAGDAVAANRAEWMLIEAGPSVLPAVKAAAKVGPPQVRERLLDIQKLAAVE